jgi:hypothetical protein
MSTRILTFAVAGALILALAALTAAPARAELDEGAVIEASNLDRMKEETFEGKTIASMLPETMEWAIREQGLKLTLRRSEEVPKDPRWEEATEKYSANVKLDAETGLISGYEAGLPFPDVSMDDPQAATKLMWNFYAQGGYPRAMLQDYPLFAFLFVDGDKGLERVQHWALIRYYMRGRLDGTPTVGDGSVHFKQLLFAHYPYDIRGLGTYTVRYWDGRMDDIWAYLRTVRRSRRLTGGAWMDPIGGTDQLNDEVEVMSAHPVWYPEYKLVGKQTILAVAHSRWPVWDDEAESLKGKYPVVDLENPPYWNPVDDWEPREVYVIEAKLPDEHPYSKKVMYLDADTWVLYLGETYDKKGELWKHLFFLMRPLQGEDGGWGVISNHGHTIDYQRRHATIFLHAKTSKFNTPGVGENDISLGVLEAAGQGRWRVEK